MNRRGLAEGALIYTADGSIVSQTPIERLAQTGEQPQLLAYDTKKKRIVKVAAHYPRLTGTEVEIIEVLLSNLRKIRCTPEHKVLTTVGYAEARDLKEGDKIIGPSAGAGVSDQFMLTAYSTGHVLVAGDPIPAGRARVFHISTDARNLVCEGVIVSAEDKVVVKK